MNLEFLNQKMQKVNGVLVGLSGAVLLCMAFMVTYDVIVRYIFNSPLAASVEVSMLMEPYVVFLPFAFTLAKGAHVKVTLVTMRLPASLGKFCDIFANIMDVIFFTLLCYFSWLEFWESYEVGEIMLAAIRLPWWIGKFAMPVGLFFICLQGLLHLSLSIQQFGQKPAKAAIE